MSDPFERYYQVLGLDPGASWDEVNQAYKDLAFVWHPDRLPQDNPRLLEKAAERLKAINEAREQLRSRSSSPTSPSRPHSRPNYYDPRAAQRRSEHAYQGRRSGSYSRAAGDRPTASQQANRTNPPPREPAWEQPPQPEPPPNGNRKFHREPPPNSHQQSHHAAPAPGPNGTNYYRPYYRDLSGIDLSGADLREKDLSGRNLQGANLRSADLADSFLHGVNLEGADLSSANLFRANLLQANLRNANLEGANLVGADLSGADLSGANLRNAKMLSGNRLLAKLTGARLAGTTLPDGTQNH